MRQPQDCPRYDRCSANVCAFDADWRKRSHVRGDEVCFYLLEAVKPQAIENFESLGHGWVLEVVRPLLDDPALPEAMKSTVEGARLTGSRIVNQRKAGDRLRAAKKVA